MRRVVLIACLVALALPGLAHAGEQTIVLRSSHPIAIKPYGVVQGTEIAPSPAVDGYVTGISATLVDTKGVEEPISNIMLHHIVFAKIGVPDYTCKTFTDFDGNKLPAFAQRFYGEGEERTTLAIPSGYGYPNRASDRWGMTYMLMNHRNVSDSVYIQYSVRYVTGEQLTPVKPVWLDVRNCDSDPIFNVPGNGPLFSTYSRHADFTMPESGVFVGGGAHLHGGGLKLALTSRSCGGRKLFTSEPTWGLPVVRPVMHENGPKHMTTFSTANGIPVSAGESLRLTATYENSLPHTRVMGIMILYFAPGSVDGLASASVPPTGALQRPPYMPLPLLRQPRGAVARNIHGTWVGDYAFGRQRVSIRRGTTFTWRFVGSVQHDVTLASGPVGFASQSLQRGSYRHRFSRPGTYRLYCSLHPTRMTQIVTVR